MAYAVLVAAQTRFLGAGVRRHARVQLHHPAARPQRPRTDGEPSRHRRGTPTARRAPPPRGRPQTARAGRGRRAQRPRRARSRPPSPYAGGWCTRARGCINGSWTPRGRGSAWPTGRTPRSRVLSSSPHRPAPSRRAGAATCSASPTRGSRTCPWRTCSPSCSSASAGSLEVDTAAVLLLDEDRGVLLARAARGLEEEVRQGVQVPLARGFAGRVAAEDRPIIIDDLDHAEVVNPILRQKGIRSMLGVPVQVEEPHDRGDAHWHPGPAPLRR